MPCAMQTPIACYVWLRIPPPLHRLDALGELNRFRRTCWVSNHLGQRPRCETTRWQWVSTCPCVQRQGTCLQMHPILNIVYNDGSTDEATGTVCARLSLGMPGWIVSCRRLQYEYSQTYHNASLFASCCPQTKHSSRALALAHRHLHCLQPRVEKCLCKRQGPAHKVTVQWVRVLQYVQYNG